MSVRVFSPPSSVLLHESQILANIEQDEDELAAVKAERRRLWRLRGSFFLFGLINNGARSASVPEPRTCF